MGDYRLEVAVRNNRILSRAERLGFRSLKAFAREFDLNYQQLSAVVRMAESAKRADGKWKAVVEDAAAALGVEPEALFTDRQAAGGVKRVVREVEEAALERLQADRLEAHMIAHPESAAVRGEICRFIDGVMGETLNERQRYVIDRVYGLDGKGQEMLCEIASDLGVTPTRARQIHETALNKLRREVRNSGKARDLLSAGVSP